MSASFRRFTVARAFNQLLRALFPAVLLVLYPASASAQADVLREGMRVRMETPTTKKMVGVVRSLSADSVYLYIGEAGSTIGVPRQDIRGLRISQGRSAAEGAKRGALWGAGAMAAFAAILGASLASEDYIGYDNETFGAIALQMVGSGALWGAGIGALVKSERWDRISLTPRIQASSSGPGLGLSVKSAFLH